MCLFHQQVTSLRTPSGFGTEPFFNKPYLTRVTKPGLNVSGVSSRSKHLSVL